ncbi:alpha/beta hydrolase [Arcanobacterium hippocoleae]
MIDSRLSFIKTGKPLRGTIVAFHGVTDSAASLMDLAEHYNSDWEVILVDTLGHGLSERFSEADLKDPFAAMVRAAEHTLMQIASGTPTGRVVLCGHSLGGAIAAKTAFDFPHIVQALVLEDPALLTAEQFAMYKHSARMLVEKQETVSRYPSQSIESLREAYPNWPPIEYLGWAQGKMQVDLDFIAAGVVGMKGREILQTLSVPTLLVTGDGDDVLFGESGLQEVLKYGNPNIQTIKISNAAHTVRRDQSADFYHAVDSFFDQIITHSQFANSNYYLNPELVPVIAQTPEQTTWNPAAIRDKGDALFGTGVPLPDNAEVTDVKTGAIFSRIIQEPGKTPERVVFAIHGGGYVAGRARFDDLRNTEIVSELAGTVAVSPEYRLAPETPYPGAVEDCISALKYCFEVYPDLPVYVYGDSAGAGLANQMLQLCDETLVNSLAGLILLEPCIDSSMSARSYTTFSQGPIWTRDAAASAWAAYLGDRDRAELIAPNVLPHGVPPTIMFVNPADPLRDEALTWAAKQIDQGAQLSMHLFAGTFHGALSVSGTKTWTKVLTQIKEFVSEIENKN